MSELQPTVVMVHSARRTVGLSPTIGPSGAGITTLADLREHLQWAIELEERATTTAVPVRAVLA